MTAATNMATNMTMTTTVEVGGAFPALPEWSALAEESTNIFLTPEWLLGWWSAFGRDRPLVTVSDRDEDGRLRACSLLYRATRVPLRSLRFVGHGAADELGPVCAPSERPRAAEALFRALRSSDACDLVVGEQLAADLDWPAVAGGVLVDRIPSPLLRISHDTWADFLASQSGHFRYQIRHAERRLAEAGLTLRLADDSARLDADLDAVFALHGERFSAQSDFIVRAPFHRAFAHLALERGWLRLWLLEQDGRIQAAWYGFRFGGCDVHYQSARSDDCPKAGGTVLIAHTVRAAIEDGLSEYRFLRGGESYKYRWANADVELQTVAIPSSRVAGLATRLARRDGAATDGEQAFLRRSAGRAVRHLLLT